MKLIKFLIATLIVLNAGYLIYITGSNSLFFDYFDSSLMPMLKALSFIQDAEGFGEGFLLVVESGIFIFLWTLFLILSWLYLATTLGGKRNKKTFPTRRDNLELAAKPHNMAEKIYQKYQEAAAVSEISRAGSVMLVRSFLENIINECYGINKSTFFNNIAKLKQNGDITNAEADLLHKLRRAGNVTSHQKEFSSNDIKQKDLDKIFRIIGQLVQDWYARKGYDNLNIDIEKNLPAIKGTRKSKSSKKPSIQETKEGNPIGLPRVPAENESSG